MELQSRVLIVAKVRPKNRFNQLYTYQNRKQIKFDGVKILDNIFIYKLDVIIPFLNCF